MFKVPILFLIFNRPEHTRIVFEAIRKMKPTELFVAADGPRPDRFEDDICRKAREIALHVDWDCEVKTLMRDENLGCGLAVSGAINWFFEHVEQGIILEDDCLPNESFFLFCEALLERYKDREEVMHISGNNFLNECKWKKDSYYFSKYVLIWGWATWKRAWEYYDFNIENFPQFINDDSYVSIIKSKAEQKYWLLLLSDFYKDTEKNTWDYQWLYCIWSKGGVAVVPNVNLVSNIGFGLDSTHTHQNDSILSNVPTKELNDIIHPENIRIKARTDIAIFRMVYAPRTSLINHCRNILYKIIPYSHINLLKTYIRKL